MCDCIYCQGDKPWPDEPNDWPHTPPLHVYLDKQSKNSNFWWYMPEGHRQNIAEAALDLVEDLTVECKMRDEELDTVRGILTDLIEELRSPGMDDYRARLEADRAEARLREVQGE